MKKCLWCKGKGRITMKAYGFKVCMNCKGTGVGRDGGSRTKLKEE